MDKKKLELSKTWKKLRKPEVFFNKPLAALVCRY